MSAAHYTVRVSVPGEPQQVITTIASGPAAAVSAVQYHLIGKHEASAWKRARFSCRSGWWWAGMRIDPQNNLATAMALGGAL